MPQPLLILNGPNLNLLGTRAPETYGDATLEDVHALCARAAAEFGMNVDCRQSNHEGTLIDWLQQTRESSAGVVINPAGLTHTSVSLADALAEHPAPVAEVHLSNIHRREPFRRHSYVSAVADAIIVGCGATGYSLAVRALAARIGADRTVAA